MTVYVVALLLITLLDVLLYSNKSISLKSKKHFVIFVSFFILFLISGLRGRTVGQDTWAYYDHFKMINTGVQTRWEPLYILLNRLLWLFTHNAQWLIIATSGIVSVFTMKFINDSTDDNENPFWSIFLFVVFNFFFISQSTLRQACAIAIAINIYPIAKKEHYDKRDFLSCLGLIVAATCFHYTAIVTALFIFPFLVKKMNRTSIFYTVIISGFIIASYNIILRVFFIVLPQFRVYLSNLSGQAATLSLDNYVFIAFKILIIVAVVINPKSEKKHYYLAFLLALSVTFTVMKVETKVAMRVAYYFDTILIIAVPEFLKLIRFKESDKIILKCTIYALGWACFFYLMIRGSRGAVPYLFFWQ